jgi:chromate reductase
VANALPDLAPDDMTIVPAPAFDGFPFYNADLQHEHGFPKDVRALADAVHAADGVMFVTPEYNFSVPGALKNALDWLSRLEDRPFAGKPVAIQSAATGPVGGARAQYHLRQIFVFLDAIAFTRPEVFVSFAKSKVDEVKGELVDEQTRHFIKLQLAAFGHFIRKIDPARSLSQRSAP